MLSDRFQGEMARMANQAAGTQQQRDARDAFIQTQFPFQDTAFANMVDGTIGKDSHLSVTRTQATDHFTNHSFATLNKTITAVQSTLYGMPEIVTFTPALESRDADQFGVIRITADGLPDSIVADPGSLIFAAMMKRGVLMRGKTTASLMVPDGSNFTPLNSGLLENFLVALFIRS